MRSWTTKEARLVLEWAQTPADTRSPIEEIAGRLGRSIGSIQQFLRRVLPRGQWPWTERPRWTPDEIEALQNDETSVPRRSRAAAKKYANRHRSRASDDIGLDEELGKPSLTVTQVAADLGLSRASVYRLLEQRRTSPLQGRHRGDVIRRLVAGAPRGRPILDPSPRSQRVA